MDKLYVRDIDNKGIKIVTKELQDYIDQAASLNKELVITKGIYKVSALFLKSNMTVFFEDGATLLGCLDESLYPLIKTRIAGIEMESYPGILNINNVSNTKIYGNGIINGMGRYYWEKYWGKDTHGGMREIYDSKGLRFLCDYDCKRVRNLCIESSNNITVKDITSEESGFWNIHVLYSNDIILDNIKVKSDSINSPSTDGIDIDSSYNVLIENCHTKCNDDSISIKSGRDSDGLRVGIPSHDITIRNCKIDEGFGITLGSEVSGGIYNINIENIEFKNTDCGFRIKSSLPRKGYIRNINISNLKMLNVKYVFHLYLNWNPLYSICKLPEDYKGEITPHLKALISEVPDIKNTEVSNIEIRNVESIITDDYEGISRVFNIEGFKDSPISNIIFKNMNITAKEYGVINYTENIQFENVRITIKDKENLDNNTYDNR